MRAHIFFASGLSRVDREESADEVTEPFFVERAAAMRMLQEGQVENGGAALALALLATRTAKSP
jgi:hypothetical protein